MNPDLQKLQPYPFEKLRALFAGVTPANLPPVALSIGEPKHASPAFVMETITRELPRLANYPTTKGLPELRQSIARWVCQRFKLETLDAEQQVLPVNGTREALFAFAQAIVDRSRNPLVISPNPFYQIYEGAAFLAGAEPLFLACDAENGFLPDFSQVSDEQWQRCQLLFICTPGNPSGATLSVAQLQDLIRLADQHDFIIASDECYSEIYPDEANPPAGLLQAAAEMGRDGYDRCVVFHSLSKRSNLPGLRSGFVAGDARVLDAFLQYRTYHGCAMPVQHQLASISAWDDEDHVIENRRLYREKFAAVTEILNPVLPVTTPDGAFYLWPETPICDQEFARRLYEQQHVTVLPGSFLSREVNGRNPGSHRVRMALVAEPAECIEAAQRIRRFIESL
ncbi:N-succinyldiaminopimelate aminotransferase [Litorivivens lipolytica]|uniref:N-succinyldiaminopimelate aminotransferase n=1 Tax=Litorivivens lipolytica TaxID=1524264 RepID=A0A7W4Z3Y0_9GAMM|nr:N-succinyldiaminopimelate aminotransferase [Litorivivens lipolytica]